MRKYNLDGLSVKHVKTFTGNEGRGFNATVYWKNKKVGLSYDDAGGGPVMVDWTDRVAEKAIMAKVAELPGERDDELDFTFQPNLDAVLWDLVDEFLIDRKFRYHCRTKIVFQCEGDDKDEWRFVKGAWTKANKAALEPHYAASGTPITSFYNAKFGEPK